MCRVSPDKQYIGSTLHTLLPGALEDSSIIIVHLNQKVNFSSAAVISPTSIKSRGSEYRKTSGHGFKFEALLGLKVAGAIAPHCTPEQVSHWAAGGISRDIR